MVTGSKHVNISGRQLRKLKPRARKLENSKTVTKPCLMCTPKLLERPHKSERVGRRSTQSPEHNSSRSKITPFYDPPNRFRSPPRAGKLYLPPWGGDPLPIRLTHSNHSISSSWSRTSIIRPFQSVPERVKAAPYFSKSSRNHHLKG